MVNMKTPSSNVFIYTPYFFEKMWADYAVRSSLSLTELHTTIRNVTLYLSITHPCMSQLHETRQYIIVVKMKMTVHTPAAKTIVVYLPPRV
jgi:hypothetical protein